ncbi:hypothetical protein HRI_002674600 [Hibiscus trionum]|uniref:Mitochondrial protein n=1 Tax=Hibiscus trionum TaxID=183268 RepID=A0A9W7I8T5_HIBTR|nr:hypothetical protein HRI_002674600 [Hibiscus trionum]
MAYPDTSTAKVVPDTAKGPSESNIHLTHSVDRVEHDLEEHTNAATTQAPNLMAGDQITTSHENIRSPCLAEGVEECSGGEASLDRHESRDQMILDNSKPGHSGRNQPQELASHTATQTFAASGNTHSMVTRSKVGIFKPKIFNAEYSEIPSDVQTALQHPKWKEVVHSEYKALMNNGT